MDKTLYNDDPCLVASNKQQILWRRIRNPQEHWIIENSSSRCRFLQSQSSHCDEKCADRPIVSIWCIWWQEEKYALHQQQQIYKLYRLSLKTIEKNVNNWVLISFKLDCLHWCKWIVQLISNYWFVLSSFKLLNYIPTHLLMSNWILKWWVKKTWKSD